MGCSERARVDAYPLRGSSLKRVEGPRPANESLSAVLTAASHEGINKSDSPVPATSFKHAISFSVLGLLHREEVRHGVGFEDDAKGLDRKSVV